MEGDKKKGRVEEGTKGPAKDNLANSDDWGNFKIDPKQEDPKQSQKKPSAKKPHEKVSNFLLKSFDKSMIANQFNTLCIY